MEEEATGGRAAYKNWNLQAGTKLQREGRVSGKSIRRYKSIINSIQSILDLIRLDSEASREATVSSFSLDVTS